MKKLRFRFSLTALLLAMAVTSVGLGIWLSLLRPTQMQWSAVRPLIERGARVETTPSDTPDWIKRFFPPGETENVNAIFFRSAGQIGPGDLDCLRYLPHLKRLYLDRCGVTDADVEQISKHQPLERLALWGNEDLTNKSAEYLVGLENLQIVDIHTTGIDWRAVETFNQRPELLVAWGSGQTYDVRQNEIGTFALNFANKAKRLQVSEGSTFSVLNAKRKFDRLYHVNLDDIPPLTAEEIDSLAKITPKDLLISIENCVNADDAFMELISKHFEPVLFSSSSLQKGHLSARHRENQHLEISFSNFSPEFVERFSKHSIFAEVPTCRFWYSDEDTVYAFAKQFKKMKLLEFTGCIFNSFEAWLGAPKLNKISMRKCHYLDSIKSMSKFESLKEIHLSSMSRLESIDLGSSEDAKSNLYQIYIHDLPSFRSFASLVRFESLGLIEIRCSSLLTDVSWISGLGKLKRFHVNACPLDEISNLSDLPALQELHFEGCHSLARVANCDFGPSTKLTISSGGRIRGFDAFENVAGLTELQLGPHLSISSCENVERLSSLQSLWLLDNGTIESLAGLEKLPDLEVLDLGSNGIRGDESNPIFKKLAGTLRLFYSSSRRLNHIYQSHREQLKDQQRQSPADE